MYKPFKMKGPSLYRSPLNMTLNVLSVTETSEDNYYEVFKYLVWI